MAEREGRRMEKRDRRWDDGGINWPTVAIEGSVDQYATAASAGLGFA